MLLHDTLCRTALAAPDKTAIIAGARQVTFREIAEDSDRLAAEFQRLGVIRGDRVAAMLDNSVEFVVTMWAALKAGAVFIPVNFATKAGTLAYILADAEVKCLVAQKQLRPRIAEAAAEVPVIWGGAGADGPGLQLADILTGPHQTPADPGLIDQDLAFIIYTSGSTGKPKGVMMTHHGMHHNVWSISSYLGCVPSDVVLCVLPITFNYGLFQILTGAGVGFTVVLERTFTFPVEVLKKIAQHRVTGFPGVPTVFARLLDLAPFGGYDLSSLRYLTNAAAALPPAHILRLRELLPQVAIYSMYGITEATRVTYLDPALIGAKPASSGRAIPNTETYLVDEDGRRLGPNQVGELVVRGSSLMRGYWRRPEDTARALRDHDRIPGEKVLYTGDLFWMDEDGDLFFAGRRDDVFKCRGEKVCPKEVEDALYELDGVAEAAVTGVADPIDGMAVKAFVVLREGSALSEQTLRRHCTGRLEPWLQPKFYEFCAELPKTESGKITRRLLREGGRAAE